MRCFLHAEQGGEGRGKGEAQDKGKVPGVKCLLAAVPNTADFITGPIHILYFFHDTLIPSSKVGPT